MRWLPIALVLTNLLLIIVVGAYEVAMSRGVVEITKHVFVVFLAALALSNLFFIGIAWQHWQKLSVRGRVLTILWGWYAFWCWIFCPFYFLLVMNVDAAQLRLALFSFVWEVILCGVLYTALCYVLFRPLHFYVQHPRAAISKDRALYLYQRSIRFPLYAALLIFGISVVGFGSASAQERLFTALPYIETIKNYLIGFVAAIFLALIYYVLLSLVLEPVRSELQEQSGAPARTGSSIARRVFGASFLVVLGSLFLLQLVVIKSFQTIVRDEVYTTLTQDVPLQMWDDASQKHGAVFTDPDATAYAQEQLAPATQAYIASHASGILDDFQENIKLVAFFIDPSGAKSVIVIPLDAYYGPLFKTILSFVLGAFFILLVGLGIVWLVMTSLTKSLNLLTGALRNLEKDPEAPIPHIASGDEVEDLATALGYFVRRTQQIDQEKYEFISIASHQLRTPLTELRWLIEAVQKGDPAKNIGMYLPDINTSITHLIDLEKMLLDSRRFESGIITLTPTQLNVETLFATIQKKYDVLAKEAQVHFVCHAAKGLTVTTDEVFFTIVVESLVSNAIQYTPADGRVTLIAEPAETGVKIRCSDTGIGIAEEEREHIFEKFGRGTNAKKVRPNGTGLGLYLAKQSLVRLGGSISFESVLDQGTTFIVLIPPLVTKTEGTA